MNWKYNILKKIAEPVFFSRILLFFSLAVFSSCTKDILDKVPSDSYSDAAVWNDANLINLFVNNTYRRLPTGFTNRAIQLAGFTDEAFRRGDGNNYINSGNITPSQFGLLEYWTNNQRTDYWTSITKCNLFMSKIESSPVEATMKNRMIGEMKFFRAYAYFKLVAFYGPVPLITKPFTLTDDFNVSRNTYDECMNFVISELDAAADLLPAVYTSANLGHITKGAALAAKSRALLYMASPLNNPTNSTAKWQAAADAAKAVIDMNIYSLYPSYKDQFLRANSYNCESIWSRPYNYSVSSESVNVEQSQYPGAFGGYGQLGPYQNLIDEFETVNGLLPADDPTYNPQNPYINRDPRFYATILYDGAIFKGRAIETFLPGGLDSPQGPGGSQYPQTGYYMRKFIDESVTSPSGAINGNSPWIFIRYAEILLNFAEAKFFLGDEPACRQYLNMVRNRPGVNMPPVTESGAALLTRLQHERQIELVFEEHRWFDVRRWKIAPVVLNNNPKRMDIVRNPATGIKTYTINTMAQFKFVFTDKNYLLPIPQDEINKCSSLLQNPGY